MQTEEEYYLRTDKLTVGYNGKPLLKDIELGVYRGQILTLIGPNGSGKSTVLKNIIREMTPLCGVVVLDQKDVKSYSSKEFAKRMSVVLTEKADAELLTCRDVVAMGRYPYTNYFGKLTQEDERIVDESLESVSALDIADRDFSMISDGQRQRIMLARAICQKPEIMVLDEPTSFLDIRHKIELLDILQKMAVNSGVTVIVSLHEIELAARISDHVMCIRSDGGILCGAPSEIFKDDIIRELYGIKKGSYSCMFGCTELEKPKGEPSVFVAGGAGSGVNVYRRLQHFEIPFFAGILAENDCEYIVAEELAAEVVSERAFMTFSDDSYNKARSLIDKSDFVIDAGCPIGDINGKMTELLEYAYKCGKTVLSVPTDEDLKRIRLSLKRMEDKNEGIH